MVRHARFLLITLVCFTFYLLNTGLVSTVYAAQHNSPATIYGKVTDVITTKTFTYVEVESNNRKIWAAGPVTPIHKGDMISFSTTMPMRNFHSKSLGRDFAVLFITNRYSTATETSTPSSPPEQVKHQPVIKPGTAAIAGTYGAVKVGGYLRAASLDGLNGTTKTFSAFQGKPLIINIWASWCGPCRAEMGSLQRLAQRYNGKDFNIIGISTDDYRDKASALIKQTGITFENFLDHNLLLENMLGAKTIPLTLLVDADGCVLKKVHGSRAWDSPKSIDTIADVFHVKLK